MRAVAVTPGAADSARLAEVPEPDESDGPMLVDTLAVGVCGTDLEICRGDYGTAPPGLDYLVIGHESLGRVVSDPTGTHAPGDLVVGIVRRPCTVPCPQCAAAEWDMCTSGAYTERGIKGRAGYCSQHYRIEPDFAVPVPAGLGELGVLLEPTTVVAKAWEHVFRIGARGVFRPRTALITGAGPIGLLAALLGVQRGLSVHVLDLATGGPKPTLVGALGATYHSGRVSDLDFAPDVVVECTGVPGVVIDVIEHTGPNGIVCLTGVSSGGRTVSIDAGMVNRELVLGNDVVFGSVNANRRHYEQGVAALQAADPAWLAGLITRRVPLAEFASALRRADDDIKVVIDVAAG